MRIPRALETGGADLSEGFPGSYVGSAEMSTRRDNLTQISGTDGGDASTGGGECSTHCAIVFACTKQFMLGGTEQQKIGHNTGWHRSGEHILYLSPYRLRAPEILDVVQHYYLVLASAAPAE